MNKDPSVVSPKQPSSGTPSREYLHSRCGGKTRVDGHEFLVLADPFSFVTKTKCCECGEYTDLDQVAWSKSQETIAAYRARVRSELSPVARLWAYGVGPMVGACVGGVVGACWPPHRFPEIVTGLIGGAIIGWLVLQISARKYLGMDFRSQVS